jgi:glycosyltransferase involved in cell wall biosynthesis
MLERNDLHEKLNSFDIAVVPLKTRIYGSVPPKIFEYGSLGFPILYFGGGEGGTIVAENNLGWVADVGNYIDFNQKIDEISKLTKTDLESMKKRIFNDVKVIFNLDNQINDLIKKDVF